MSRKLAGRQHVILVFFKMSRVALRVLAVGCLAFLTGCASFSISGTRNTSKTFTTVVVDAGHGGKIRAHIVVTGRPKKWWRSMWPNGSNASCASRR